MTLIAPDAGRIAERSSEEGSILAAGAPVVMHHVKSKQTYVSGSLGPGSQVILAGPHRVAPGQAVTPVPLVETEQETVPSEPADLVRFDAPLLAVARTARPAKPAMIGDIPCARSSSANGGSRPWPAADPRQRLLGPLDHRSPRGPTITTLFATIVTPYPGSDPVRVEALVTEKIEEELRQIE